MLNKRLSIGVAILLALVVVYVADTATTGRLQRFFSPVGIEANRLTRNIVNDLRGVVIKSTDTKQELRAENNRLRLEVLEIQRLRQQNRQLRQELEFRQEYALETVSADVVNYNPDPVRDMIRINIGREEGVEQGMPVVAQSGLVGIVDKVTATTATVILVTDTSFRALARTTGDREGVLKGQIAGGLMLEQLPKDSQIEIGDIVSTSGLDGVFPPDILIGTIRSVSSQPGEVFDVAQVSPALNHQDLQVVTVIKGP